jgi:ribosomal protein S18 acetylase RimI-like enzyme
MTDTPATAGAEAPAEIRRGTPEDARALSGFAARLFAETFGPSNRPEDLETYLTAAYGFHQQTDELMSDDVVTLLAESQGEMVAYAQVRRGSRVPDCVRGPAPVELWRFYVDSPWQGSGLGVRLMSAAMDSARALGGGTIWLSVWEQNPRAIAFYRTCGFRDVGTKDFWVGSDRQTDRVMVAGVLRE